MAISVSCQRTKCFSGAIFGVLDRQHLASVNNTFLAQCLVYSDVKPTAGPRSTAVNQPRKSLNFPLSLHFPARVAKNRQLKQLRQLGRSRVGIYTWGHHVRKTRSVRSDSTPARRNGVLER